MRRQPPPPAPDLFIERLRQLVLEAKARGISREAIAKDCGFDRGLIGVWLNRKASPSGSNLATIAAYFKVGMDWLWGRPGWPKERLPVADGPDVPPLDVLDPEDPTGESRTG